jgi:hypothetical protein
MKLMLPRMGKNTLVEYRIHLHSTIKVVIYMEFISTSRYAIVDERMQYL